MQRAPCLRTVSSDGGAYTSNQSLSRTGMGRVPTDSRSYSRKPVILPNAHLRSDSGLRNRVARRRCLGGLPLHAENSLVLVREDFNEFRKHCREVFEDPNAARAV